MEEDVILTFKNTREAIMGERKLLDAGIAVRVMPMPRKLGSVCGIALRIPQKETEKVKTLLDASAFSVYSSDMCLRE